MSGLISPILEQAGFAKSKLALAVSAVVNYVAKLDGELQHWILSSPIVIPEGADFEMEVDAVRTESGWGNLISGTNFRVSARGATGFYSLRVDVANSSLGANTADNTWPNDTVQRKSIIKRVNGLITANLDSNESVVTANDQRELVITKLGRDNIIGGNDYLTGYVSNLRVSINNTLTHSIPLTNKAQGAYQVATTTPLGANLYTQDVIENPSDADDQWTYLGNGRWQLTGDGSLNALQFVTTPSQPTKGYVQFEIESISGGTITCAASSPPGTLFDAEGVKTFYYSDISEVGQVQFKRRSGAVQAIIKNIKHYDAEGILVAEMVGYTPDVWEVVKPEPVNYVARLDGTQYYELSEKRAVTGDFEVDFLVNFTSNAPQIFVGGDSHTGCFFFANSQLHFRDLHEKTGFTDSNFEPDENKEYLLKVSVVNGMLRVFVDGDEQTLNGNTTYFSGFYLAYLATRNSGEFKLNGYIKNFNLSEDGASTIEIPLTNKSQGATQLPTVGNVSATMIGYTGDEWEEV
jgi:hypothetical protein